MYSLYNRILLIYIILAKLWNFLSKKLYIRIKSFIRLLWLPRSLIIRCIIHCYTTVCVLLLQHRENEHAEISMIFTFVQFHETFYVTLKRKYSSHSTNSKSNLNPCQILTYLENLTLLRLHWYWDRLSSNWQISLSLSLKFQGERQLG